MTRLPPTPSRDEIDESERGEYDRVVARQAKLWAGAHTDSNDYFGALLNSPIIAGGIVDMGRLVREGEVRGSYTNKQREIVDMAFAVDFGYDTILKLHLPDALSVGVRVEAVDALRAHRDELLDDEERLIVTYARQVVNGTVTDETFGAIEELLGRRGAVDFTVFIGFMLCTFRCWQALGVPDTPREEIDAMLQGYRDGTTELFDPAARIG
jgi:hypothetical protein